MGLDRTGDEAPESCCRNGWVTPANSDNPQPCRTHKAHLFDPKASNDFAERTPSARAQAAIERDNQENRDA